MKRGTGGTFVPVNHVRQAEKRRLAGPLARTYPMIALLVTAATIQPAIAQRRPFAARPSGGERQIDIRATTLLEYNDNVVLNDPRISQGGSRGDALAAPSIDVNIVLPRATGSVYLVGTVGYRFYKRYTNLNREAISLTGGADQRLGPCVVHGEVSYQRQLSDLSSIAVQDTTNAFNNTEQARNYTADVGCGAEYGLRPAVSFTHTELRNSLAQRRYADADTNSVSGQLGLTSPSLGTVALFGRMSDSKYIHRVVPIVGGQDGIKSYAAGVQLERSVANRLNFRGSVNYTKVDPKLASTRSFSGIGFDLSAAYSADLYNVQITGSRTAQPSAILFVGYEIVTTLSGSVTRKLSERIQLTVQANRTWRELASSPLFPGAPIAGNDVSTSIYGNATFKPNRRLSFTLGAGYDRRTTTAQLFQYRAKRINLSTSLSL